MMSVRERWILAAKAVGVGALVLTAMAALFLPIHEVVAGLPV